MSIAVELTISKTKSANRSEKVSRARSMKYAIKLAVGD